MIKNIPAKFTQNDLIQIIDQHYRGKYNYFYLPMDMKTKLNSGFAFINMISPFFILDFYLQFNCVKWSDMITTSQSQKLCKIVYANTQGIEEVLKEFSNKSIMKKKNKNDKRKKPIIYENM